MVEPIRSLKFNLPKTFKVSSSNSRIAVSIISRSLISRRPPKSVKSATVEFKPKQ